MVLIPTPNHTEQHNNAKETVKLGAAVMTEQDGLSRETLLSRIEEIIKDECFAERAMNIQEEVSKLDGLKTAIQTTIEVAKGSDVCVSA